MDMNELRHERATLFHDACDCRNKGRVPHFAAFVTWKVLDAGYKLSEVFGNYDRMEECVRRFLDRYKVDTLLDTTFLNVQFSIFSHFGEGYYYYSDESEAVGVKPFSIAPIEELLKYCENPTKYLFTKALPKKWPDIGERTLEDWQKAFDENQKFGAYYGRISKIVSEEYGLPAVSSSAFGYIAPFMETMFNSVRGIKGLSVDVRRNPEIIKKAVEIMDGRNVDPAVAKIYAAENGHDYDACFDLSMVMLVHTILSNKSYDELYWPTLKKIFDACEARGKNVRLTIEGSGERIFDHFAEYKPGTISLYLEEDDIFKTREKYPDICLIGGMTTTTLGRGTKDECIDLTKKLINEVGRDSGYIFGENKFICYRSDANGDNLKAVCDYLNTYHA